MKTYLNNLIEEKGLDLEEIIEVEGASGTNFIPLGVVVEHILIAPDHEKKADSYYLSKNRFSKRRRNALL